MSYNNGKWHLTRHDLISSNEVLPSPEQRSSRPFHSFVRLKSVAGTSRIGGFK